MTTGPASSTGPLRRHANHIIAIFLLIQVGLVLRATIPMPGNVRGRWPWRMFERRSPWERVLQATGIDRAGARHELPLHQIFGYSRGTTGLYAYHQLEALNDPAATVAQSRFAAFLARRMAELGSELSVVDLRWLATNLDTGEIHETPIGTFSIGAQP
jgi:hypothetical protein